jgi:hypothetical protein
MDSLIRAAMANLLNQAAIGNQPLSLLAMGKLLNTGNLMDNNHNIQPAVTLQFMELMGKVSISPPNRKCISHPGLIQK